MTTTLQSAALAAPCTHCGQVGRDFAHRVSSDLTPFMENRALEPLLSLRASRHRIQCLQHSASDLLKKAFADKVVQQADKTKTLGANCPLRRLHQVHAPEMRAALLLGGCPSGPVNTHVHVSNVRGHLLGLSSLHRSHAGLGGATPHVTAHRHGGATHLVRRRGDAALTEEAPPRRRLAVQPQCS